MFSKKDEYTFSNINEVFKYVEENVKDKPFSLYTDKFKQALKSLPHDIGLNSEYGTTQIENAISEYDVKTVEEYASQVITPYLTQRKELIQGEIIKNLSEVSKKNNSTLEKTISSMTQNEVKKIFTKSKRTVENSMLKKMSAEIADPNIYAYNAISNVLKTQYLPNSLNVDMTESVKMLAESFKGDKPYEVGNLLKRANIDTVAWGRIKNKIFELQKKYSKKFSTAEIERIIRGQIEKRNADISGGRFDSDYKREGIKTYLKAQGYDSFVTDDGKLISGGANFSVISPMIEDFLNNRGFKTFGKVSYNVLEEVYQKILEDMSKEYTKTGRDKTVKQSKKYEELNRQKELIENELRIALRNTKDKNVVDNLLSKKVNFVQTNTATKQKNNEDVSVYQDALTKRILKDYEKDPWFDEWYDESKDIKQENTEEDLRRANQKSIDTTRENHTRAMKVLDEFVKGKNNIHNNAKEIAVSSLKDLIEKMTSGSMTIEEGSKYISLIDSSLRDSLGLMSHSEENLNTISIQGMGGNDIGYSNGKVFSTGYRDNDDFDPNDYEMQQKLSEEAGDMAEETVDEISNSSVENIKETFYNSFRNAALSAIELRREELKTSTKKDLDDFYGGKTPEKELKAEYKKIDENTNRVANMVEKTTAHRGRDFSSNFEQLKEDANALSDILEFAKSYETHIETLAKQQAKIDGVDYNEEYLYTYAKNNMPDEEIQARILESKKARSIFDNTLESNGDLEKAIRAAIGTLDSKIGKRIFDSFNDADEEDIVTKVIGENGEEKYFSEPSEKQTFVDWIKNQMAPGEKSINSINEEYINEHDYLISPEEYNMYSPAKRRQLSLLREKEWGENKPWYSAENTPINIDKMESEYNAKRAKELSEKVEQERKNIEKFKKDSEEVALKHKKEQEKKTKNSLDLDDILDEESTETVVAKKKKTSSTKKSTKKKTSKTDKTKNVSTAIKKEDKEFQKGTDIVQDHTVAIQNEKTAEEDKITISESLAKVLQEEKKAFENISSVEKSTNAIEENTNAIKENSEAKKENAKEEIEIDNIKSSKAPISPSRLISGIFGDNFSSDDSDFERILTIYSLNNGIANAQKLGISQGEGKFKTLSSNYYDRLFGTIEHLQSQISDEVFNETGKNLDIDTINNNSDQYSQKIQGLIKEYNSTKKIFYANLEKLGFTEEDLSITENRLRYAVEKQQEVAKMLSPTGHAVMSEVPLMGEVNGQEIHGVTDKIYLDDETLNIGDLKNKYSIKGDREAYQLGMYQEMLIQMKQRVTDWDENRSGKPIFEDIEGNPLNEKDNDRLIGILRQAKYFKTYIQNVNRQLETQLVPITGVATEEIGKAIEMLEEGKTLTDEEKKVLATKSKHNVVGEGGYIPAPENSSDYAVNWFKKDSTFESEQKQKSSIVEVIKNQKAKDKLSEQIDLLERKAEDPSETKGKVQSYLEQIKLLQQKLAILNQTQFILNEEGNLVKLINGEEVKSISLNEQQQQQLKEELLLLEKQHSVNIARNSGYTGKPQEGLIEELFGNFQRQIKYMTTQSLIYKLIGGVQQTLTNLTTTIKELDKAMVDLQIASGYTRQEMKAAMKGYNEIAVDTGRTTEEVLTAANDWLRAGFDIKSANELIRDSMKLSTLGMIDSAKATEYLISTLKGWKLQTDEVADAVDDLTALDMAFATSAGDIAQAMAKGNVSASLAGMDRKTYEAMLTAVMDVGQQGADVVGTAFKTLFARYGNVKSGKYASNYNANESGSETSEETVKLNDIETVLNKIQIKTRDSVGQFRDIDEVLSDIAEKWNTIDQVSQNAVSTALGGTRQREVVNTLFENWGSVEKAKRITETSSGTADQKMENYTESIEAAQKGLQASVEKLTTSADYEKWFIRFYNLLSALVDNTKPILLTVGGLMGLKFLSGGGLSKLLGGIQNVAKYTMAPGYWMNEQIQNRRERRKMTDTEKVAFKRNNYISELDNVIVSANARMKDNGVAVRDNKGGLSTLTTEDYNNVRNFLTNNKNNFKEVAKLSEKDWENVASAIEDNFVQEWLNAKKNSDEARRNTARDFGVWRKSGFDDNGANVNFDASRNILNQAETEEATARQKLARQLGLAEDATAEEVRARLKLVGALSENEETVDIDSRTIRARGKVATDRNVKAKLNADSSQGGFKNFVENNGAMIGTIGGVVGTGLSAYAAQDMSSTGGAALTATTSALPMIGSLVGSFFGAPAIGAAVGGAVSAAVGGISALIALGNKTSEEIQKEAQEANKKLSAFRTEISKREENRLNLKDNEVRFAELVKGVNVSTGVNVSLSDSEWSEYQNILSTIIEANDDLYASYDAQGNIVAQNAEGIADLNKVMADSIELQKKKVQEEYIKMTSEDNTKNLRAEIRGEVDKLGFKDNDFTVSDNAILPPETTNDDFTMPTLDDYVVNMVANSTNIDEFKEYMNGILREDIKFKDGEVERYYNEILSSDSYKNRVSANKTYGKSLKERIGYYLKSNEEFNNLESDEQSFVSNQLFGMNNISYFDKNGKKKTDKQIEEDVQAYGNAATIIAQKIAKGEINLDNIINYDKTIDNANIDETYLKEMINIANKSGLDEDKKESLLSGYGFIKDENGNWITNRMASQNVLSNKYGFNKGVLNELSTEMLNALFNNKESLKSYNNKDINTLKNKLKEFTLGNNATLSQYLADFSNEMGIAISNTEEFAKALDTAKGKGTFAFEKLQKLANNLGIDIHELADHASTLGSIDANGYNSKSLSEIETQFEDIENIVNDLTDNSTISAENVEKIIEDFPELVKYLDDSDKLLEKFQSLQGDKSKSQVASLKRSFAESDEVYKSLLNDTKFSDNEYFDKIIDQKLGMFKNGRKFTEFMNTIYDKDVNDNYTGIKSEYEKMSLTDNSSYSQNSWEKLIGENIFGIDTSTGTKEDIQKKIYNAMKAQAEKMGIKNIKSLENGGNEQLTEMFTGIIGQTDFMAAFQRVSDLQNQLSALKTAKAIEDSKWEQRVSDAISKLKQDFEEGRTSIDDYIKGLQQIKTWANLTAEQQNELNEAIEEARFDKVSDQYEKGAISVKAYRDELSALMKLNASGSSQYKQYADAYISSYDTELNKLEAQKSLVTEKDFAQQRNILTKENAVYEEKLMALVAAGKQNAEEYLETQEKIKSTKEAILELDKKELELHKEDLETTMSAYITLLDYGISQLEKEKSLLEERYDEEIDKLKEVNDQKQRSIDLEKYQQQLENAKKEKSRVYVAGNH